MPRLAGGLLMFGCGAAALPAAGQPAPVDPPVPTHANVVDVRTGRVTADATLVLRGGRIESIGATPAPSSVRTLDLKGKYVLPGLIDAHTHADNFAAFQRALESGVTTMRSAGVSNYADVGFHELVQKGAAIGPDIVPAGYHVRPRLGPLAVLDTPQHLGFFSG